MATHDDDKDEVKGVDEESADASDMSVSDDALATAGDNSAEVVDAHDTPANLGALKYVHAAFFAAAILAAYLTNKIINTVWNQLANWPAATKQLPQLQRLPEDQREVLTMGAGAVVGLVGVIWAYRKPGVRQWADDVATELSRVTWPTKETVMNGTLVVIVASAIATVYVTILDRFWGFVTTLVYGA
jgi:preprotein translocase subunit SecE